MPTPFRFFACTVLAATSAVPAFAQSERCITPAESQAVVAHLMPELLRRVEARCTPLLGSDTFLAQGAEAMAVKASPLAEQSGPAAIRALERQSGSPLPKNEILLSLGRQALAEGLARELDAQTCASADRMIEQLEPLPPRNLANLVALAIETGVNSDPDATIRICTAP